MLSTGKKFDDFRARILGKELRGVLELRSDGILLLLLRNVAAAGQDVLVCVRRHVLLFT